MSLSAFCCVPGCVEPAAGAVLFAYVKEQRHGLCAEHIAPVRRALLAMLGTSRCAGVHPPTPSQAPAP